MKCCMAAKMSKLLPPTYSNMDKFQNIMLKKRKLHKTYTNIYVNFKTMM